MRVFLVLFLSIMSLAANATQTKYILFEPNCMDRLEYRYNNSSTDFITYQIHNASGIIALEVGVENQKSYNRIPKGTIGCNNSLFDEKLVRSINNNLMDVYIVMPIEGGQYHISPVRMASYMTKDATAGKMIRPDYEYTYSGSNMNSTANLATASSESQVFFMDEGSSCQPYHFRSISKNTCRPMSEVYYLHGIGIVEERVGATIEEENENKYTLRKINGVSLDEFKEAHCKGRRIQLGVAPKPEPAVTKVETPKTTPKPVEFVPRKCQGKAKSADHHLVQYGESLFGIARREGVTVNQLRKWNHLKSNKIYACSQLKVTAPVQYAAAPTKPKKKFKAKGVTKKKTAKPAKKYVSKIRPTKSTTGVHPVQKGENLYMLATLYGYTVDRFAHMNGLNKNAVLKPGMELFTTDCSCPTDTDTPVKHEAVEEPETGKKMPVLAGSSEPAERVIAAPKVTYHIVEEGETIWTIANNYGFETDKLMERNNLEAGEVLIPGQKIYFPK